MKPNLLFLLLIASLSTHAQIATDGTLGQAFNLPGPDYQISADLGQQHGGNLFHSFQNFNLQSFETATFSGPNHIQNVISRVTGGNPSHLDGTLRSTIPNADMYFINPYGIMFGPHAQLDVQGSFHASTADYLRFEDGGHFDARNPNDSLLTVAPIESFGFLDNPHSKIEVNGRGVLNESENPRALLQVPKGKSLSLIGGDIELRQGVDELPLEELPDASPEDFQAAQYRNQRFSQLYAPGGTLNLASIRRAGEIALMKNGMHSTAMQGGTIHLEQEAYISTTGESGGNVFVRAGELMMDNSTIDSRTLGIEEGGVIHINADHIELSHSKISGGTDNIGDGTDIQLFANEAIDISDTSLNTRAGYRFNLNQVTGDAGHIRLQAKDIEIKDDHIIDGLISTDTFGTGQGGNIDIIADNHLRFYDTRVQAATWGTDETASDGGNIYLQADRLDIETSGILTGNTAHGDAGHIEVQAGYLYLGQLNGHDTASSLQSSNFGSGDGGDIHIQADTLLVEEGSDILSTSFGSGNGGNINIWVTGDLTVRGTDNYGHASVIFSGSREYQEARIGDGGDIRIQANTIQLTEGGRIDASSQTYSDEVFSGQAGNIVLDVTDTLIISGINRHGKNADGFGSAISSRSQGNAEAAGNIQIQASEILIQDGGLIESGSYNQSDGGQIQIHATRQIIISDDASHIQLLEPLGTQLDYLAFVPQVDNQSISCIYAHSTSRAEDSGDSGTISVTAPQLTLSRQGQISTASQGGGQAGQIILNVGQLILSGEALIRSNSDLPNQFVFDTAQARDNQIVARGTVIKIQDIGEGKSTYHINLGKTLVNIMPQNHVTDLAALENLSEQIQMIHLSGHIVIVENTDHGKSERFMHLAHPTWNETWTRINEDSLIILEQAEGSLNKGHYLGTPPPYADGTQIHVKDMGNGKAANFIYAIRTLTEESNVVVGVAQQIKYYQVSDMEALQELAAGTDLLVGTQVDVNQADYGKSARFVFDGADWVRYGPMLQMADVQARQKLVLAKPGHLAHLPTGYTIYTGSEWIDLGKTYRVNNLAERDALNIQSGDLVKVADVGNGRHDAFLYVDGQWIRQIRGGDAGQIVINADKIQLNNGSEISTGSISGGGGGITLNVDKLVYLTNSQISTSVQEGAGSGGDLTINGPQFVIMNNGQTIAQAYEGNGGNIHIVADQLVVSPNSLVSASSKLGLDGHVEINAVNENVTEGMLTLSSETVDASSMMKKTCETMTYQERENRGHFAVHPLTGTPLSPFDLQPSHLLQITTKTVSTKRRKLAKKITNHQPNPRTMTICKTSPTHQAKRPVEQNRVIPEQLF
jgi:filamentous hemagglutinin family protein